MSDNTLRAHRRFAVTSARTGTAGRMSSRLPVQPASSMNAREAFVTATPEMLTSSLERSFKEEAGPREDHDHTPGLEPLNPIARDVSTRPRFPVTSMR